MFHNFFKGTGETKNIAPKIFAIVLAVVLWLYVMNEQNPPIESSFTIPLEVRNAATSYVIADVPETVKVKVRGPRSIVAGVLTRDLKAYVDVKGLTEGRHNLKVLASLPASLELVEVNPDSVPVRLDTTVARQVPIEVRFSGTPAKGFLAGKSAAGNELVTIEGPKNVVGTVEKVIAVVDLSGKTADITADAALVPVNKDGREVEGLTIYPEKTRVTVSITEGVTKKMIDIKPVTQGELPTGFAIKGIVTRPDKVEVREVKTGKGIENIDAIYTEPIVLKDIVGNTEKEVKLQLPEGLTSNTTSVTVSIKVGPR